LAAGFDIRFSGVKNSGFFGGKNVKHTGKQERIAV